MVSLPARLQDHHGERLNYNQWWTQKQNDNTDGGLAGVVVSVPTFPIFPCCLLSEADGLLSCPAASQILTVEIASIVGFRQN
jgi:hypothetical protein